MASLELDDSLMNQANIKVIGVGGGGGNAVNTMISAGMEGVEFIAANTDAQVLDAHLAQVKVHLGSAITRGLGAGGNPEVGRGAALEQRDQIAAYLAGADMVFVTAGMGGGTGTGAAPVIAEIARDSGVLTVGVVTKPFAFEGKLRMKKAEEGIADLSDRVDALIVIPNEKLIGIAAQSGQRLTMLDAFQRVDEVLLGAVRSISDIINVSGLINVDFADVRTIMTNKGRAIMGTGHATGHQRAVDAARAAINSPLLEDTDIRGASGLLINVTGGPDLGLTEINEAIELINNAVSGDALSIFGTAINANFRDEVVITVIATGFAHADARPDTGRPPPPPAAPPRRTQMAFNLDSDLHAPIPTPIPESSGSFAPISTRRNTGVIPINRPASDEPEPDFDRPAYLAKKAGE